jgi:nitrous oxidase accessory protein
MRREITLHIPTALAVAAVALCLAVNRPIAAETLIVAEKGAAFSSVQAAIDSARPGDLIQVRPGHYHGNIVLHKSLTLEGEGKPILRGTGEGSVLTVLAPHCVIRGLLIEHCGGDLQKEDSGILLKSSGNRLENNDLRDILYGIYLYQAGASVIRGNVIRGRVQLEIGERGAGLHLWDSPGNVIEDNQISETRDGLYIQSSPDNLIRRNRVTRLCYGVHYMFSNSNRFEENLFSENMAGAAIMYSSHIEFRRNAFLHNRGFSSFGILFQECDECLAEENFVVDNGVGIFMEALRKSLFRRNVIAGNDVALEMFSSAEGNTFTANNFVDNLSPLYLIGKRTSTRWEKDGRGNYWSDYGGYDLDADGIGDEPHKVQNVFEYLEGNYPRLRLYLESPAAQAIAMAEKMFPIIRGSNEQDRAPLMKPWDLACPYGPVQSSRSGRALPAGTSLSICGLSLWMIWRVQRRPHESVSLQRRS